MQSTAILAILLGAISVHAVPTKTGPLAPRFSVDLQKLTTFSLSACHGVEQDFSPPAGNSCFNLTDVEGVSVNSLGQCKIFVYREPGCTGPNDEVVDPSECYGAVIPTSPPYFDLNLRSFSASCPE